MAAIENFLKASKAALVNLDSFAKIKIVMGNQTCDLDSAVCALTQAFFEHEMAMSENSTRRTATIPIMNVPAKEFRLKTEVVYYFKRHHVPTNLLTFRDEIDLARLCEDAKDRMELILVDHHALTDADKSLAGVVVGIIDHRPRDPTWPWNDARYVHLRTVGSCATLVARNFLDRRPDLLDSRLCSLLRGPILVDTCNFSKEADRATDEDREVIEALERIGSIDTIRQAVYSDILEAKTDVSSLTPDDLMIRDLKYADCVPIAGFPMLAQKFLELDGALNAVDRFTRSGECPVTVLIGLDLSKASVTRDIAVFSLSSNELENKIIQALTSSITEPFLDLTLAKRVVEEKYTLSHYKQGNTRASRKQILPIVLAAVSQH